MASLYYRKGRDNSMRPVSIWHRISDYKILESLEAARSDRFVAVLWRRLSNFRAIAQLKSQSFEGLPEILRKNVFGNYSVQVPTQWETVLHCNVASHWLDAYTKRFLRLVWYWNALWSHHPQMNLGNHRHNCKENTKIYLNFLHLLSLSSKCMMFMWEYMGSL